jgi:hypothetical protein
VTYECIYVFVYLEEVLLLFNKFLCNSSLLSILELCSMFTLVDIVCTSGLL